MEKSATCTRMAHEEDVSTARKSWPQQGCTQKCRRARQHLVCNEQGHHLRIEDGARRSLIAFMRNAIAPNLLCCQPNYLLKHVTLSLMYTRQASVSTIRDQRQAT